MAKGKDSSSIFWNGIIAGGILYFLTDSFGIAIVAAIIVMLVSWLFKGVKVLPQQEVETEAKAYAFDFDSLSTEAKSQLLKQQFDYFLKYRSTSNGEVEFYCAEDTLDGYRFSFWIEYLVESPSSHRTVKVKEGNPICNVYIFSNKGESHGYEKFVIKAPVSGIISGFLKGSLQKGLALFRVKEDSVKIVREEKEVQKQEVAEDRSTVHFDDVVDEILIENESIEVENLEDVLKWEMPNVEDIEMPEEEGVGEAFNTSDTYRVTITNLSGFDWYSFKAICYSSTDESQKEVKHLGEVKVGEKVSLSSSLDMFYVEGKNVQGERKRFRPFAFQKDGEVTITIIFEQRD